MGSDHGACSCVAGWRVVHIFRLRVLLFARAGGSKYRYTIYAFKFRTISNLILVQIYHCYCHCYTRLPLHSRTYLQAGGIRARESSIPSISFLLGCHLQRIKYMYVGTLLSPTYIQGRWWEARPVLALPHPRTSPASRAAKVLQSVRPVKTSGPISKLKNSAPFLPTATQYSLSLNDLM